MRCLNCHRDDVPPAAEWCPHAGCGVHLPSRMRDLLPPGTELRGGAYRIVEALGQGGFGITYRGWQSGLARPVAIKEFFPQGEASRLPASGDVAITTGSAEGFARTLRHFVREGRILAGLDHPGIVRVMELFEERGTAYLVMELITGRPLSAELEAQPAGLGDERVRIIVEQLVAALAAVHAAGVFHLDISPDNVLLRPDGRVALIDFGAARQSDSGQSTRAFKPDYAPLELLSWGTLGPQTDLYELGMLTHELLTGRRPPPTMARLNDETWEPHGLAEPWAGLLRQALRLRPEQRPAGVRRWWQSRVAVAPTVLAPAPWVARVEGGAGYPSLWAALAAAPVGATVLLAAGSHDLRGGLSLDQAVTLRGAGIDATELTATAGAAVLRLRATAGVTALSDLTLRWAGDEGIAGDVLRVEAGEVRLARCRFTGGRLVEGEGGAGVRLLATAQATISDSRSDGNGGCGILFQDSAGGTVRAVTCRGNAGDGLALFDQAAPLLEQNVCEENGEAGIAYAGEAQGTASGNTCQGNTLYGIWVGQQAAPALEQNRCTANQDSGIAYFGEAHGTATANVCQGNGKHGIAIDNDAAPLLRRNICAANGQTGIAYFGIAQGTSGGNTCRENGHHGIVVQEQAAPLLLENLCERNTDSGLRYAGQAQGAARANICRENGGSGITLDERSAPLLEQNRCTVNSEAGIGCFDQAGGSVRANLCHANGQHGIATHDQAAPLLEQNQCERNKDSGIACFGDSRPATRGNTCRENACHGIYTGERSAPLLEQNRCERNGKDGIALCGQTVAVLRGNQCAGNGEDGIAAWDEAAPHIDGNSCLTNAGDGIALHDRAGGVVRYNHCQANEGAGLRLASSGAVSHGDNKLVDNRQGSSA